MKLTVNGEAVTVTQERLTVSELLGLRNVESPDMVSVQLNGDILEREAFDTTAVNGADEVEFLYFMGGGVKTNGIE